LAVCTLGTYSFAGPKSIVCMVEGVNGENLIRGEGGTLEAAYRSACDQAQAVGMFGRLPGDEKEQGVGRGR
jgi:hypothetical protein